MNDRRYCQNVLNQAQARGLIILAMASLTVNLNKSEFKPEFFGIFSAGPFGDSEIDRSVVVASPIMTRLQTTLLF
ncbi:MAG: hypothetical protein AAGF01_19305 [Cyanobacteria bacterium P01_G01_bin.38]